MKPDKGHGVVILDRKFYDKAIQEIILKSSMQTQKNKLRQKKLF